MTNLISKAIAQYIKEEEMELTRSVGLVLKEKISPEDLKWIRGEISGPDYCEYKTGVLTFTTNKDVEVRYLGDRSLDVWDAVGGCLIGTIRNLADLGHILKDMPTDWFEKVCGSENQASFVSPDLNTS